MEEGSNNESENDGSETPLPDETSISYEESTQVKYFDLLSSSSKDYDSSGNSDNDELLDESGLEKNTVNMIENKKPMLMISLTINDSRNSMVPAIIDTGANFSCINTEFHNQYFPEIKLQQEAWRLYVELFLFLFCSLDVWMSFIIFIKVQLLWLLHSNDPSP